MYFLLNNELISVVSRSWGAVKLLSDVPKTPIYRGQSLPLNFISYSYNMLIIWAFDRTWDIKSRNDTIESLEWSLMRYTWFESGILLSPYHVTPGSLITQYTYHNPRYTAAWSLPAKHAVNRWFTVFRYVFVLFERELESILFVLRKI